jgi:hypothetical protein
VKVVLDDLKERASRLLITAAPEKAISLLIYSSLSKDEIAEFEKTGSLDICVDTVSKRTQQEKGLVRDVIERYVKSDLAPHPEEKSAGALEGQCSIESTLMRTAGKGAYFFSLYGIVHIWDPTNKSFSMLRLEDDALSVGFHGYLRRLNRAYDSSVSLLEAAQGQSWQGWQTLWRYF